MVFPKDEYEKLWQFKCSSCGTLRSFTDLKTITIPMFQKDEEVAVMAQNISYCIDNPVCELEVLAKINNLN